jgi:hypothetical protein
MDERYTEERREVTGVAAGGVSAVSWAAVLAGAVAAAAVSLLLFSLASGLDLAVLSANRSAAPLASLGASAAIALIVTQWFSAGLGGYITGRLRTRWVGTHTHEVFFRDTAHGFLTWSVVTVFMASGLVPVGSGYARSSVAARAPAALAGSVSAPGAGEAQGTSRGELLLRLTPAGSLGTGLASERTAALDGDTASQRAARVTGQLLLPEAPADTQHADMQDADMTFLARLGPAPGTREARQAAAWQGGTAERQDAALSIFTALSMLIGAFVASVSAALGGRLRDRHP